MLDVVCVGAAHWDTIAVVAHPVEADERVSAEQVVEAAGGPAAIAAVAAARQGASVGFCGVVGDDVAGKVVREGLFDAGVDVRWCATQRGMATARSVIITERQTGRRAICAAPAAAPSPSNVPVSAGRWLHVDQTGYQPAMIAMNIEDSWRPSVSVDGGNPVVDLALNGLALYAPTTAALADRYGTEHVETGLRAAIADGASKVVATAGSAGAFLIDEAFEFVHVPAFEVDVVSSLGAGDVFHGALMARLAQGARLLDAVRAACATAALSCRAVDGSSGIPDRDETDRFLDSESAPATYRSQLDTRPHDRSPA